MTQLDRLTVERKIKDSDTIYPKINKEDIHSSDDFGVKRITELIKSGVSYPDPLITFDEAPFIFPYTVNIIQGGFGSFKSYFASHIAAACLNPSCEQPLLRMRVNEDYKYNVVYLDTERPIRDQLPAAMAEIIKISKLKTNSIPANFHFGSLKKYSRDKRLEKTIEFINNYKSDNEHTLLILDVVTDCMGNFNDLKETNYLMDELNKLTEYKDVTIIGIIHENPDGSRKARGHIGTEFVNKATTAISIGYKDDKSSIVSIKIIKNRLARRSNEKFIKMDEKTRLLVFADDSEVQEIMSRKKIKLPDFIDLLVTDLGQGEYETNYLINKIGDKFSVSEKTAREAIITLQNNRELLKEKGFRLELKKGKYNKNIYLLKEIVPELDL